MIEAPELLTFLQNEEARAVDATLNEERQTAIEFYNGDKFGDEVEGRSQLRTRDVSTAVDYMTVSIMRTLDSGDRIAEFEPIEPGQEELAQEATDRIHWNFLREQNGFAILHDGIKAGLLEKSGIWKSRAERRFVEEPRRLNANEIEALGDQVTRAEPVADMFDLDEAGMPVMVYDAMVRVEQPPLFRDEVVPNEEFFVCPDARTLDTAVYLGNISRVSLADLVGMGYSEEDVETLNGNDSHSVQLSNARDAHRSHKDADVARSGMSRIVTLREEYVLWFENGANRRYRVHRVGSSILSVEPVEFQPYSLFCPFPMPHRLIGQSLADKTMDIMVVRSHMLRQAMDALYLSNAPRVAVSDQAIGENTIDDLLDVAPGGIVRYSGAVPPTPFSQPFVADPAFKAMEIMAGEQESRTGITRLNQGLDADALNKTATGTALMQASGQQIEEYVARNAANAIAEMFEKKLRLMASMMPPHQFRLDGQERLIDPSRWPQEMRLHIRVGLGTNNKDRRLQALGFLKQTQGEAMQVDPRLVGPEQAFETAKLVVNTLGLGMATQFFNDPANFRQQGEQPDPAVVELQAKMQAQQAELQMKWQAKQAELALKAWERRADLELQAAQTAQEAEMAYDRMVREFELRGQEMAMEAAFKASIPDSKPGGSLAQ